MVINFFRKDKLYSPMERIGDYTILEMLGEGRYGICYLVSKENTKYILKQIKQKMLKDIGDKVYYEEKILAKINHECIPKFIEKIASDNLYGYIIEYKEGDTFEKLIYRDNVVFQREELYNIGIQLISILKYLHSLDIIHRDIRVPNTLYHKGKVQLIDFGLSRYINNERYTKDMDFWYLGDFLLHLYYTSYEKQDSKNKPWHEELDLSNHEKMVLSRLLGMSEKYNNIEEIEKDFMLLKASIIDK